MNQDKSNSPLEGDQKPIYLALSGGVGGAKLALGLSQLLAHRLFVMANTSDDFIHLGLNISPDLDTVMYTLANLNNKELGWGLANESWQFMNALEQLNQPNWFRLGDRDLATHITRTELLKQGNTLSQVTQRLTVALDIEAHIFPMTDQVVSTFVRLEDGSALGFQEYFVKEQCQPKISGYFFEGIEKTKSSKQFISTLDNPNLAAIIICPSNPFVSIEPILSIPETADAIRQHPAPVIAVSPIIAGQAVKGPTAKMMQELGIPSSVLGVAEYYQQQHGDLIDCFIIDHKDQHLQPELESMGLSVLAVNTMMNTLQDRVTLAGHCLSLAAQWTSEHKEK